jgi:hypothetical protein
MKTLTRDDLMYLAGFIDGDGAIIAQVVKRSDYKWKFQLRLTLQFTQKTKRLHFLQALHQTIGVGYVRTRSCGCKSGCRSNNTNVSDFVITETKNVYDLLKLLQPFLRLKQKQANLVIKIIEQLPSSKDSVHKFLELCEIADHVASLNDSKSRENTIETVRTTLKSILDYLPPP